MYRPHSCSVAVVTAVLTLTAVAPSLMAQIEYNVWKRPNQPTTRNYQPVTPAAPAATAQPNNAWITPGAPTGTRTPAATNPPTVTWVPSAAGPARTASPTGVQPSVAGANAPMATNADADDDYLDDDQSDGREPPVTRSSDDDDPVDVDIESLKPTLVSSEHGPAIEIYYKVEIEDFRGDEVFDLVITIREGDRVMRDTQNRVIRPIIQLSDPYEADEDEMKFKRVILVPLPPNSFQHPSLMSVTASVYLRNTRACLDRCERYVRY